MKHIKQVTEEIGVNTDILLNADLDQLYSPRMLMHS